MPGSAAGGTGTCAVRGLGLLRACTRKIKRNNATPQPAGGDLWGFLEKLLIFIIKSGSSPSEFPKQANILNTVPVETNQLIFGKNSQATGWRGGGGACVFGSEKGRI